jgi:methionine synthase I (cobalamin-dependent)/5,10-methylenetetrahydrofolate reductase
MNGDELTDLLQHGPLLCDGGMGTSLVELGALVGACFELLNVEDPGLVESVHRGFVEAGARLILTNTFGATRFALARRGLEDRVAELNARGVEIARRTGALVAGSVGPLRVRLAPYGRVRAEEAFDAYAEQIEALTEAEVDLIMIETQSDLNELQQALMAARKVSSLAVVASATFTRDDRTLLGGTPEQVAERLADQGADVIGVNCGQGPAQALRVIRAMRPHARGIPLSARPNAGGPLQVGGRFLYPATPDYFAEHARALLDEGVSIIGGCCGTGPAHIRAMAEALVAEPRTRPAEVVQPEEHDAARDLVGIPTELSAKLAAGEFVVTVEMDPPRGFSSARMLAGAETLAEAGADVINVADSPMARMRMSPWAACRLIQEHVGIETVLHFPTRGRNLLRLQGDLLAVHALGIRNLFVVLGDPVSIGDYPTGTDNVDVTATGLLALITGSFNQGRDQAGASIGEPTSFVAGCAVNPAAPDLDRECRLLKRKVDSGAAFALSQPVYSVAPLRALRRAYEERHGELTLPILAGVLPLINGRHAEFLHNEVPGISIPEEARDRLRSAGERGEREGLRMAVELGAELRSLAEGIYLVPQFGRHDVAAEIVESLKQL